MVISEARVATTRPGRYLAQFCKHAAAMSSSRGHRFRPHGGSPAALGKVAVHAEWSDTDGTVTFDPWGRSMLRADLVAEVLIVRVEARDVDDLRRIQNIISADFDRFGRQKLSVDWRPVDDAGTDFGRQPMR